MARGIYTFTAQAQTVSTAITILEVTAPATAILVIQRAWIAANTTTAAAINGQILRKSVACTGTASPPTPNPLDASAASGVAQRWKATVEGTAGAILYSTWSRADGGEWVWLATPREQIIVPPSGILALKFATAPASNSFDFGIEWDEIG